MAVDANTAFGPARFPRNDLVTRGLGIIAETVPRSVADGAAVIASGTVYFAAIGLLAGDVVTNISIAVQVAGATVTTSKVGLYSAAGARLAVSADQGAGWESTGIKTIAMTSAYTVATAGLYYIAAIAISAVTMPQLVRHVIATAAAPIMVTAIGSGSMPYAIQAAQTDLPTTATLSGAGTLVPMLWGAVS